MEGGDDRVDKKESRTEKVMVVLTRKEKEALASICERKGMSYSSFLRMLFLEYYGQKIN